MDTKTVEQFVDDFVREADPIWTAMQAASWNFATTGDDQYRDELVELKKKEHTLYRGEGDWEALQRFYENRETLDHDLRRQVEILYVSFLGRQSTPEENQRIAELEAEVQGIYTKHRATVGGQQVSDNDISEILLTSSDERERREAWEGSKEVGAKVAELVRELARTRNQVARRLGFRDHYEFSLTLQEIDEDELLSLFDQLATLSEAPFRAIKSEIDDRLRERLGLGTSAVMPWHYSNQYLQEIPPVFDVNKDVFFADADVEALSIEAYDAMGMDVRDILERSDLYEREGKNQHAFCTRIGREGDVRILCNLRPNARWMSTQMHELGHAVYYKYLDYSLPYMLRGVAHTNSTEAIAMIMGRLPETPEWLTTRAGADAATVDAARGELLREQAADMLTFVRWVLVMLNFERELYADPDRDDLNQLWWDLKEKYQLLTKPAGRDEPDWAAKYHVAMAPVYYHNYVIGQLTASQLWVWLTRQVGGLVENEDAGRLLIDEFFAPGARYRWNELVEVVTGEPLRPEYFVEQFVGTAAA